MVLRRLRQGRGLRTTRWYKKNMETERNRAICKPVVPGNASPPAGMKGAGIYEPKGGEKVRSKPGPAAFELERIGTQEVTTA